MPSNAAGAGTTRNGSRTHVVANQPPPLEDFDALSSDGALVDAVRRHGGDAALDALGDLGRRAGSAAARRLGVDANRNPPALRTHDRYGNRIDEVDYHPAYHALMTEATGHGLHATPWGGDSPAPHVTRAAGFLLWSQVESGHGCPISMTYAAVPALRAAPDLAATWEPRLTATAYDPRLVPLDEKAGALLGMAMTEKQGGSDVRANTTTAVPSADHYLLTGHKWFCSAPMSDGFLVLAQAPGGLTCFLLPRVLPGGERNAVRLQRLKDKLGNRSNASSEIELDEAVAWRVGDEGRGVRAIIEMVRMTRLDCVLGTAGLMRAGVAEATHHAAYRTAFGSALVDAPLMRAVLADLAIESEAATLLAIRLAATVDAGPSAEHEAALSRIATAVGKYWVCKRGPVHAAEAMECLGGNGYVEESPLPRLYREAPVNSIWEGSGNVNALDVLRAMAREPACVDALLDEIATAAGADRRLDTAADRLRRLVGTLGAVDAAAAQAMARVVVETMALTLQGALLVRYGHPAVADAYCASRLAGEWGHAYGTLPAGVDTAAIVERARPKV